jgi:hypothetical protein
VVPGLLGVLRRRGGGHDLIKLVVFHAIGSARPVLLLGSLPFLGRVWLAGDGNRLGGGSTPKVEDDAGTDTLHDPALRLLCVLSWFLLLIFGNRFSLFSEARSVGLQETLRQECAGLKLSLTVAGCVPGDHQLGIRGWGSCLKGVMHRDAGGRHETRGVLMVSCSY